MKIFIILLLFISCSVAHFVIQPNETLTIVQPSFLSHDSQEMNINLFLSSPFEAYFLFQVEIMEEIQKKMVDKQFVALSGDMVIYQKKIETSRIFFSFRCLNDRVPCVLGFEEGNDQYFDVNIIQFSAMFLLSICVLFLAMIQRCHGQRLESIQSKV
jgi:hypothetical protein